MAFIDWLRDQHRTSEGNRRDFEAVPFQRTPHQFMARNYGSRANMPSPLATGGAPAPNPLVANVPRAAPVAAPTPQIVGGNAPFVPQFDRRSGYGVSGMGGNMPQVPAGGQDYWGNLSDKWIRRREGLYNQAVPGGDGMWELIVAALMDKWGDVKEKGKKMKSGETKRKLRERIERNRIRRARRFDYEG